MTHSRPFFRLMNPLLWDAAAGALIVLPPLAAALMHDALPHPWNVIVAVVLVGGSLLTAYGTFIEPGMLFVNKKIIHTSSLPSMRIAVAADFHIGPFRNEEHVRRAVRTINELLPDVILLPGDFVFDDRSDLAPLAPLKELRPRYGTFAIAGNHDSGDHLTAGGKRYRTVDRREELSQFLASLGIRMLRDEHETIRHSGKTVAIAGLDGQWRDEMRVRETCDAIDRSLPLILLSHNPDVVMRAECARADLIVSGHTHGGQIRFPIIGPVHVPAETGKRFAQGIFRIGAKTILAVTHGLGETLARARLFCPPEILLLDIRSH